MEAHTCRHLVPESKPNQSINQSINRSRVVSRDVSFCRVALRVAEKGMAGTRRRRGGRQEARSPAELTSSSIISTELSPSLSPPAGRRHGTGKGGWLPSPPPAWTRWPQPDEPSPSVSVPARCTERGAPLVSCDAVCRFPPPT